MDPTVYLKLLLPSPITVTHLTAIQKSSGCSASAGPAIQPTDPSLAQFFNTPGAGPMSIALLAGPQRAVQTALDFIIEILTSQFNQFGTIELRLVVPNSSISPIMGKAGTKITSIREGTGAKLQISGRDAGRANADVERIVHISGHPDQVRNAARIVSSIMQADTLLKDYMVFNVAAGADRTAAMSPYGMEPGAFANSCKRSPIGYAAHHPLSVADLPTAYTSSIVPASAAIEHVTHDYTLIGLNPEDKGSPDCWIKSDLVRPEVMQVETTVHIQIPDELVGSLMGRNGQSLTEIRNNSAAKINISQRGELVPGTRDRLITIKGPMKAVHTAHALIVQRLAETQDSSRNVPTAAIAPTSSSSAPAAQQPTAAPPPAPTSSSSTTVKAE